MATAAQVRATSNYIREHTRRFTLQCNNEKDADVIAYLDAQPNYTAKLKELIRSEIAAK